MQLHRSNNLLYRKAFWPWKDLLIFFTSCQIHLSVGPVCGEPFNADVGHANCLALSRDVCLSLPMAYLNGEKVGPELGGLQITVVGAD